MVKPSVKAWTVEEELFRLGFTIIYHVRFVPLPRASASGRLISQPLADARGSGTSSSVLSVLI